MGCCNKHGITVMQWWCKRVFPPPAWPYWSNLPGVSAVYCPNTENTKQLQPRSRTIHKAQVMWHWTLRLFLITAGCWLTRQRPQIIFYHTPSCWTGLFQAFAWAVCLMHAKQIQFLACAPWNYHIFTYMFFFFLHLLGFILRCDLCVICDK